jgi:hypothetical protein
MKGFVEEGSANSAERQNARTWRNCAASRKGVAMDHRPNDAGPRMTERQAVQLRQGIMLGRMRYVLAISLALAIIALFFVYWGVRH